MQALFAPLSVYANIQFQALLGSLNDRPADYPSLGLNRTWKDLLTGEESIKVADSIHWLAVESNVLMARNAGGVLGKPSGFINLAHDLGLLVSAWTFRPENKYLAKEFRSSDDPMERNAEGSVREMRRYLALGLDSIITDDPALARKAVDLQI